MRRLLIPPLLLLALTAGVCFLHGQDRAATPAEKELVDLDAAFRAAYRKAQQDLSKLLRDAKTPEEAQKIREKTNVDEKRRKLAADFAGRVGALVEKYPKETDVVVDALIWIIDHAQSDPSSSKAADLLIRDHLPNKKVDALLPRLAHLHQEANEKLIRAAVAKAETGERRVTARLALATFLKNKSEAIVRIKTFDARAKKAAESTLGKDVLTRLSATDPGRTAAEAEALLELVVKDARENRSLRPLEEKAEAELYELRFLVVGKRALEIEGEDVAGKKFTLSDYRGKVVVLDFWGFW
jgi:hypothetical protein